MIFFSSFSYIKCLPKIRRSFPRKTTIDLLCWDCKNWYHFIKKNLEQISKFIFQEVSRLVGWPNRHILEILLACRNTFVVQNHWASARLHHWGNVPMTASVFFIHYFLLIFDTQLIETRFFPILEHVLSQLSKVMNFAIAYQLFECVWPFCGIGA